VGVVVERARAPRPGLASGFALGSCWRAARRPPSVARLAPPRMGLRAGRPLPLLTGLRATARTGGLLTWRAGAHAAHAGWPRTPPPVTGREGCRRGSGLLPPRGPCAAPRRADGCGARAVQQPGNRVLAAGRSRRRGFSSRFGRDQGRSGWSGYVLRPWSPSVRGSHRYRAMRLIQEARSLPEPSGQNHRPGPNEHPLRGAPSRPGAQTTTR
jgi:hypothetical protein